MMVAGVGMSSKAVRGLEFYRTPVEATWSLIEIEQGLIPHRIWEPACGDGAISKILEASGRDVMSTDIVDRGFGVGGVDFVTTMFPFSDYNGIVTNPPFSLAQDFVDRAFDYPSIHYCALLLRLSFLEAVGRKDWFEANPPARIHVSSRRLPMMPREGYEGKQSSSTLAHAWYIWLRGYNGSPQLRWFDWQDYWLRTPKRVMTLDMFEAAATLDMFEAAA